MWLFKQKRYNVTQATKYLSDKLGRRVDPHVIGRLIANGTLKVFILPYDKRQKWIWKSDLDKLRG